MSFIQSNNINSSISFLFGAGFSVPKGYPTGNDVNKSLLNFKDLPIGFSPDGSLCISKSGEKPDFGYTTTYDRIFNFCNELIEYYDKHIDSFDYEKFYDYIISEEIHYSAIIEIAKKHRGFDIYEDQLICKLPNVYNQMVGYIIKDEDSNKWYEDTPFHVGSEYSGYTGFLKYLKSVSESNIINVHTLNHDLFFESLNKTDIINGNISDGFDEFGSNYYGVINIKNSEYNCRLERYTGQYTTSIRLYKLHGSFDYLQYHRTIGGSLIPEKYIKIKQGTGHSLILKGKGSKKRYEEYPFAYHTDFLTGTTSKILRYNEPFYRSLFKKFKRNLRNAEKLIIVGYGAKDEGINKIIIENFDFAHKPLYIVDPYAGETVNQFAEKVNGKIIRKKLEVISSSDFTI